MAKKKAPSTITVNRKKYDKAYVGPHTKREAFARTKGFHKKGLSARARKFGKGWYVYVGKFYTPAHKKRAQNRGR